MRQQNGLRNQGLDACATMMQMVLARRLLLPAIVGSVLLLALACVWEEQPLAGTSWMLLSIEGIPAIGNVEVEFSDERRISGWTGCNSYDGRYRASGSSFTTEDLHWTEAGCPNHEMFMQESLDTDLLVGAEEFAISGSRLTITSSDGRTVTFSPRE